MQRIQVAVEDSYDVLIGNGLSEQIGDLLLEALGGACTLAIVTDTTVADLHLGEIARRLESAGFKTAPIIIPTGESSKNISQLGEVLESLAAAELTRSDAVVALGGGVVGDLAGFAAGCYLRGVRYVQMPTTLLAAVDSSVGGKTAVDLVAGKNLAGLFVQPEVVVCDLRLLETLPTHVIADGMAEVVKTAVLDNEEFFSLLEEAKDYHDLPLQEVISRCVTYKASVVVEDEQEQGPRKLLNLGHTVGHAIERLSGYRVMHGHAVAIGLAIIARASVASGWAEQATADRILSLLQRFGLPTNTDHTAEQLAQAALTDKKRQGDSITLVIPHKMGGCRLKTVPLASLTGIISPGIEEGK